MIKQQKTTIKQNSLISNYDKLFQEMDGIINIQS